MGLLKKLVIAFFVSFAMLAAAPSAMAKPAGKQANQTTEGVAMALDATVDAAEVTLAELKAGIDKEAGLASFKNVKQHSKTIESSTVYAQRARAQGALKKARSAFKKGKHDEAIKLMEVAVEKFKGVRSDYYSFSGD